MSMTKMSEFLSPWVGKQGFRVLGDCGTFSEISH